MSFCSKCGKEIKEDDEFCPNCGTKIEVLHTIDSTVSVAGQAKLEGVKQRIAEYNYNNKELTFMMIVVMALGWFFWDSGVAWTATIFWIFSILCLVASAYYNGQATKLREKLEKGEID